MHSKVGKHMEGITLVHLISASATLILMIGLGIYSGRKVSGAADFDTGGGRAGAIMVAGTIIGTGVLAWFIGILPPFTVNADGFR